MVVIIIYCLKSTVGVGNMIPLKSILPIGINLDLTFKFYLIPCEQARWPPSSCELHDAESEVKTLPHLTDLL